MKQNIPCRSGTLLGSGTIYIGGPSGNPFTSTTETRTSAPWLAAGVFRNLIVTLITAPGAGTSRTIALRVNGSTSALTVTISGTATTATLSGTDVSVSVNDLVNFIQTTSGAVANTTMKITVEFEGTTGESCYTCNTSIPSNSVVNYNGLFSGAGWQATVTQLVKNVAPTAGSLTKASFARDIATGAGKTSQLAINLNGVRQDGTGGTVDTTVSLSSATVLKATPASFTLPIVAGDIVYVEHTPTSTPTSSRLNHGYKFVATVDGESIICGTSNPSTSATRYANPFLSSSSSASATEASTDLDGGVSTAKVKKFYAYADVAPGSGKSYTVSLRLNAASPGGAPSVTLTGTGTAVVGDTSGSFDVVTNDLWTVRFVPASTPAAALVAWGVVQLMATSNPTPVSTHGGGPMNGPFASGAAWVSVA